MPGTDAPAERSIVEQIAGLVEQRQVELPAFPDVAIRVHEMLGEDNAGAAEVAELIGNEPALAVEVLRIANSAAFVGLHPVNDLAQAVGRLGFAQISAIVTAIAFRKEFTSDNPRWRHVMASLWDHAVATALGSQALARRIGANEDEAFLSGLLHDAGKLLVLRGVDALRGTGVEVPDSPALMDELMTQLHPRLGHAALTAWNLSDDLARVALHHHDADVDPDDELLLCVQTANLIARKLGFHPQPDPDLPLLQEPAVEAMGLMDLSLASLMVDLEDAIESKHRVFGARSPAR